MQSTAITSTGDSPSILACLRALHPPRRLHLGEALRVAERQAQRLLALSGITEAPISTEVITELPRIRVEYDLAMPGIASGASDWDSTHHSWVITLNPVEPDTRTRLTVGHEFKHILDHTLPPLADHGPVAGRPAVEYVADYFAGCLLMPKSLLTQAWYHGIQRPADLAALFDVSVAAITVRLTQLGLLERGTRCPTRSSNSVLRRYRYQRDLDLTYLMTAPTGVTP